VALANYKPFCGYWFYGAADDGERAAFYCTWGLLDEAPAAVAAVVAVMMNLYRRLRE